MSRLPVGTRIRITGNSSNHHYRIGAIYRVHQDGNFDLFSAIDEKGNIGHLAQWMDCERASIGWEWLRTQLDPRSIKLLSAFDLFFKFLKSKLLAEAPWPLGTHLDSPACPRC